MSYNLGLNVAEILALLFCSSVAMRIQFVNNTANRFALEVVVGENFRTITSDNFLQECQSTIIGISMGEDELVISKLQDHQVYSER